MVKKNLKKIICYFGGSALFLILLMLTTIGLSDQDDKLNFNDSFDYRKLWQDIDDDLNRGFPQSALKKIEELQKIAIKQQNIEQQIKATLYQLKSLQSINYQDNSTLYNILQSELKSSPLVKRELLHSLIADFLWNYYQNNRWEMLQRTPQQEYNDDFTTWDQSKLVNEVVKHYKLSLANPEKLQKINLDNFKEIIGVMAEKGMVKSSLRELRPTLYDLLAHKAIDFFNNQEAGLSRPADRFYLDKEEYFSSLSEFSKLKIVTSDSTSFELIALKIVQDLASFRLQEDKEDAALDLDLKRLKIVYQKSILANRDELYIQALQKLQKESNRANRAKIALSLAEQYSEMGSRYHPLNSPQWQNYLKVAVTELTPYKLSAQDGDSACQRLLSEIEKPTFAVNIEKYNIPNKPYLALVSYKNLTQLHYQIYKVNSLELERFQQEQYNPDYMIKHKSILSKEVTLPTLNDYQTHSLELKLDPLKSGLYIIAFSSDKAFKERNKISYQTFSITNIASLTQDNTTKGTLEIIALNRESGAPIPKAELLITNNRYDNPQGRKKSIIATKNSDKEGRITINKDEVKNGFELTVISQGDTLFSENSFYIQHNNYKSQPTTRTFYFTDRSIYRPGQTVYFKAITIELNSENPAKNRIVTDQNMSIKLFDANHQVVGKTDLKSNEFGTCAGSFVLPAQGLGGNFRITDNFHGNSSFKVEEYKRPKFKIEFAVDSTSYKLNEMASFRGKAIAYSGYGIQNGKVKYRITREEFFPYRWYYWRIMPQSSTTEIANGESKTDNNGDFVIDFKAVPELGVNRENQAFIYSLHLDITDQNGETQSGKEQRYIGQTAMKYDIELADVVDQATENLSFKVTPQNLGGKKIAGDGQISIYKLTPKERILKKRLWEIPDLSLYSKEEFIKNFPFDPYLDEENPLNRVKEQKPFSKLISQGEAGLFNIAESKKWPSGEYILEVIGKDIFGQEVKELKNFSLVNSQTTKATDGLYNFAKGLKVKAEPNEVAKLLFSSTKQESFLWYSTTAENQDYKPTLIKLTNEQKLFTLPIKESHRGNIFANISYIKNNRFYQENFTIEVPWSNKDLKVNFSSFRDKVKPNQDEEWEVEIKDSKDNGVNGEMAGVLYDASLDVFNPHNWYFSIFPTNRDPAALRGNQIEDLSVSFQQNYEPSYYPTLKRYDGFNYFNFLPDYASYNSTFNHAQIVGLSSRRSKGDLMPPPASSRMMKSMEMDAVQSVAGTVDLPAEKTVSPQAEVMPRSNLRETAFFYPQLTTNKDGKIKISFKTPEALTKWNFLGFVHTKDLNYALVKKELVTQKELMVVPNLPRFLREGDTIYISSKVVNLSDKELNCSVKLVLKSAENQGNLNTLFNNSSNEQSISLKAKDSQTASWKIVVPELTTPIIVNISAKSQNFSDGEESLVPILPNRMLVTETMPLPVKSLSTRDFVWKKYQNPTSKTLTNHALTFEFTANPAWYVVKALPVLLEGSNDNIEEVFNRLFANSLALEIKDKNKNLEQIFKIWQKNPDSDLSSNLEKNPELKNLILNETPWVMDAQNEGAKMKNIALLFDENTIKYSQNKALNILKNEQKSSGGWGWCNGMRESRYMTQYIVNGLAKMEQLKLPITQNREIKSITERALNYLALEIKNDYDELIKYKADLSKQHLDVMQIFYLYSVSSMTNYTPPSEAQEAINYYLAQSIKFQTNYNHYLRGMIALVQHRKGNTKVSQQILKSIKEFTLNSEEMGIYWQEAGGYNWHQSQISRQALLIEAFAEINNDSEMVEGMKTWLLKSKQTNSWSTTKATAEAAFALLTKGNSLLEEGKQPQISFGNKEFKVDPLSTSTQAGSGYFKTSWHNREMTKELGQITIKNNNKLPAWGAIYWQYFENLDKIERSANSPLVVKKELFVEKMTSTGPILSLINKSQLKVGDRVKVKLEISTDRDMEFVSIKDMRGSCFEPEKQISSYQYQGGLGYYHTTKDGSTNLFFDYLPKGKYILEYSLIVSQAGEFSAGIATLQSNYAPEFNSNSQGIRVKVGR